MQQPSDRTSPKGCGVTGCLFITWAILYLIAILIETVVLFFAFKSFTPATGQPIIQAVSIGVVGFGGIMLIPVITGIIANALLIILISAACGNRHRILSSLLSALATFPLAWFLLASNTDIYNHTYMIGQLHNYAYPPWANFLYAIILALVAFSSAKNVNNDVWET
jgi:hypothetical protein